MHFVVTFYYANLGVFARNYWIRRRTITKQESNFSKCFTFGHDSNSEWNEPVCDRNNLHFLLAINFLFHIAGSLDNLIQTLEFAASSNDDFSLHSKKWYGIKNALLNLTVFAPPTKLAQSSVVNISFSTWIFKADLSEGWNYWWVCGFWVLTCSCADDCNEDTCLRVKALVVSLLPQAIYLGSWTAFLEKAGGLDGVLRAMREAGVMFFGMIVLNTQRPLKKPSISCMFDDSSKTKRVCNM